MARKRQQGLPPRSAFVRTLPVYTGSDHVDVSSLSRSVLQRLRPHRASTSYPSRVPPTASMSATLPPSDASTPRPRELCSPPHRQPPSSSFLREHTHDASDPPRHPSARPHHSGHLLRSDLHHSPASTPAIVAIALSASLLQSTHELHRATCMPPPRAHVDLLRHRCRARLSLLSLTSAVHPCERSNELCVIDILQRTLPPRASSPSGDRLQYLLTRAPRARHDSATIGLAVHLLYMSACAPTLSASLMSSHHRPRTIGLPSPEIHNDVSTLASSQLH